jgi:hypothetical protein
MPSKNAIVTICQGQDAEFYKRIFLPSLQAYAAKIGADYHCITESLVPIPSDKQYTPFQLKQFLCMQKLVIPHLDSIRSYTQVAYIDADILINVATAPNIFDSVPVEKIGAVNEKSQYGCSDFVSAFLKRTIPNVASTAEDYYTRHTFPESFSKQFNAGLLVFSPKIHGPFMKSVYETYMPRIQAGEDLDYDQGPLNYEANKAKLVHYMDERWNRVWMFTHGIFYPFLDSRLHKQQLRQALKCVFDMNYAIHFAGHVGWDLFVD